MIGIVYLFLVAALGIIGLFKLALGVYGIVSFRRFMTKLCGTIWQVIETGEDQRQVKCLDPSVRWPNTVILVTLGSPADLPASHIDTSGKYGFFQAESTTEAPELFSIYLPHESRKRWNKDFGRRGHLDETQATPHVDFSREEDSVLYFAR